MNAARVPILDDPRLRKPEGSLYEREFWGITRHEAIAGAAELLLSARAKGEVARVVAPLGAGIGLPDLAGWADRIKRHTPNPSTDDADTVAFLQDVRNRRHANWHFVNVPIGADGYDRRRYQAFTSDEDVVQMIAHAARVLAGQSNRFSELSALRLVTHLVGDVHQPIHVGCCYIKGVGASARLVRDPADAAHLPNDRGGNNLLLPIGSGGTSLHSYWDSRLGGSGAGEDDAATADPGLKRLFVQKLVAMMDASGGPAAADARPLPSGAPDRWAETWATQSILAAREAYRSLEIEGAHADSDDQFDVTWEGKQAYDARCVPIVGKQMTAAANNLAVLLNTLWHE